MQGAGWQAQLWITDPLLERCPELASLTPQAHLGSFENELHAARYCRYNGDAGN